jgi:hypothetical protein
MDHLPSNPRSMRSQDPSSMSRQRTLPRIKKRYFFVRNMRRFTAQTLKRPGRIDTAESPISIPQNPAALTMDHTRALSSRPRRAGEWNPSNAVMCSGAKEKKRWSGEERVSVAGGEPGRRTGGRRRGRWCG